MIVDASKDVLLTQVEFKPASTTNNFYRLQLLQTSPSTWKLFSRWGRVGQYGEGKMDGPWHSLELAEDEFCQRFKAKTKSDWTDRHKFELQPDAYGVVELDEGRRANSLAIDVSQVASHQLVRVIFDSDMESWGAMGVSINQHQMPLGTLSIDQIERGMAVLKSLRSCLDGQQDATSRIRSLSAKFFQLIPHVYSVVVLSTTLQVDEKLAMLSRWRVFVTAMNVKSSWRPKHFLGRSLHCDLNVVTPADPMHPVILTFIANTEGAIPRHSWNIAGIWAVRRHAEDESFSRFQPTPNHRLLWHGTSMDALASIVKTGLGQLGRGIYLAATLEKAKHHVRTAMVHGRAIGCAFLVEAALGIVYHVPHLRCRQPDGFGSMLAKGHRSPDRNDDVVVDLDGEIVRVGVGEPTNDMTASPYSLLHDEYVVHDTLNVRLRYVVMFEMPYNVQ